MKKDFPGEQWKTVQFDFKFTNDCRIEVSNFGRIRTFNKMSDGNILKGSMINGYRIIRLKFFRPRDEKSGFHFAFLQEQITKLGNEIKHLKLSLKLKDKNEEAITKQKAQIEQSEQLLDRFKKNLSKKFQADLKARSIHYHALVHRLVAEYFCQRPSMEHSVVAHLDHDKLNNKAGNLQWMTPQENYAHQQKSPHVIEEKRERIHTRKLNSKATKLTVTRVMLLKKLLIEGKSLRTLVKQFKITDTQILRIKRGENWADIDPAP